MIQWGADYFKQKGVDSPRLTMELLLAHVLGLKRFDLYMQFDRPLSETELANLRVLVKRRASSREPLQYILGEAHFYRRVFEVNPSVLIPRPETEILVQEALRLAHAVRCLDVGTGSGCIGITIALERPDTEVVAIDSSADALELARRNAERLGARNITFVQADVFNDEQMRALGSFDVLVSNPPYIAANDMPGLEPEVRDHEPHMALTDGDDGLGFYRRFVQLAPRLLRNPADMFIELGFGQAQQVATMYRSAGFRVDLLTDLEKVHRILWARTGER